MIVVLLLLSIVDDYVFLADNLWLMLPSLEFTYITIGKYSDHSCGKHASQ